MWRAEHLLFSVIRGKRHCCCSLPTRFQSNVAIGAFRRTGVLDAVTHPRMRADRLARGVDASILARFDAQSKKPRAVGGVSKFWMVLKL
jgi:hypothetical protein